VNHLKKEIKFGVNFGVNSGVKARVKSGLNRFRLELTPYFNSPDLTPELTPN